MLTIKRLSCFSALLFSSHIFAGGFQLHEENVSGLGNTYAGAAAVAEDSSTGFFNPAGLPELCHPQLLMSGTVINLNNDVRFHESSTNYLTVPAPGDPTVTGDTRDESGGWHLIPAFHASMPFEFYNRRMAVGIGVTSPFGLTTSYTSSTMGRYLATYSNVTTFNIGPTIGLQLTDYFSLGAGFDAQYASAKLNAMVPVNPALADGTIKNEGDDWGYGWNAGLLFKSNFGTRFGLSYRSRVKHSIKGDMSLSAAPAANLGGTVKANFTLPDYTSLGVVHEFNNEWSVLASINYIHWSLIDTITLKYSGDITASLEEASINLNFDDTWRYAFAVNYKPDYHWKFRMGVTYDETPVPDAKSRTFRLPDDDRVWLGFGAQYKINECFTVDAAYVHIFVKHADIDQTQTTPVEAGFDLVSSATGDNNGSVNQFGLQLTWNIL